jgi:hypothetical protein
MGALSLRKKWTGHKAEHSLASSAKVKNEWRYTSPLRGAIPSKHTDFMECREKNYFLYFYSVFAFWKIVSCSLILKIV